MSLASDLKVLYHMTLKPIRGKTHAERLESFYGKQADAYDSFRARLLKGRTELCQALTMPADGVWVDFGAGTGANADFLGEKLKPLKKGYLVDLSSGLLAVARKRIAERGWTNIEAVEADATTFVPPEGSADLVTFSYSLTMIPDWFAAIDHALSILKPGGMIGVVDFYVARKYPDASRSKHSWLTRTFWPTWFGMDNVFPNPDHVPYLHRRFEAVQFSEHRAKMPYMPLTRVPYYIFLGRKPA